MEAITYKNITHHLQTLIKSSYKVKCSVIQDGGLVSIGALAEQNPKLWVTFPSKPQPSVVRVLLIV